MKLCSSTVEHFTFARRVRAKLARENKSCDR